MSTPNAPTHSVGSALLAALASHGAKAIFGIPGDFALPLFRLIESSDVLPLYTLSHEPAIGFAADAAARGAGGLGVAAVTYGAGALNAVNPIAAAYAEKSPVVLISAAPGDDEGRRGLLLHHQAKALDSQMRIFREVTCDQVRLDDAHRAPHDIAQVLASARSQSRPVYIELPRDMVHVPCEAVAAAAPTPIDREAVAACVEEILSRLARAHSPVLMVGVEIRRFGLEERVARLATQLGMPVVTSLMGNGLLAASNAPLVGTYAGVAGDAQISALVEHADALLLLGVILTDTNFGVSPRQIDYRCCVHAIDGRVTLGHHVYPDVPLDALIDALLARAPARASAPLPARRDYPRHLPSDESPIEPLDIARAINDAMQREGPMPISADAGDAMFTALDIEPTDLVAPGYYASMGFGVPAALGLQASTGRRPLVLLGDGAFQMTGWELGNCQRYGWDPIVIVLNNCSWEMLRQIDPTAHFNDLSDWHFAALAPSLGGEGVRVRTRAQLDRALRTALGRRGRFELIEVMLPRGVISTALQRFGAGVRRRTAM